MSNRSTHSAVEREFYSVNQLADCWQCSPKKVRRLIDKGDLIAHKFGAQIRISHADKATYERLNRMG